MIPADRLNAATAIAAAAVMGSAAPEDMVAHGVFQFELIRDGAVIDRWEQPNLITTQGKNHLLDTYLAGSAYTAAFLLSLYTAGSAAAGNTYASPVVTEVTSGVLAARQTVAWNAAGSGSKQSTTVACNFVGSATITGVMLVKGSSTIADTAQSGGVMFSQAALASSRAVLNGDTLNITYTLSV